MIQNSTLSVRAFYKAFYCALASLLFIGIMPNQAKASDEALNPVICPYNVTVSCQAYTWDPADYGSPIPTGGYNPQIVGPTIYSNVNSCGVGTITRIWQIYLYNSTYTCTQTITVTGNYNQVQIQWPPDYTINGCNGSTDPNQLPPPYNKPKVTNQACSMIAIAYKDCIFTTANGCKMILRKWTVIDWCVYQTNNPYTYGIWEKTQVIKILDVKAPTIVCPYDVTATVSDNSCSGGYVNIPVPQAYDDCGSTTITHNSVYAYNQGSNASGFYPVGTTLVTFMASDGCNNTAKCIMKVIVKDGKAPTAYVHHGLAATLMNMNGGMVQLTGKMFDAGSNDNCTPQNQLIFGLYPSLFTCDDLGYNEVTVTVTDKSGNTSTVKTYVIIQDNQGFCPPDTTDPTISCYNIVAFLPKDSCGSLKVTVPKPVATDNRKVTVANNSPYALANGIDATGTYPQGTTLITFTASDAAGNTAVCTSSVTVKDTFAPVVTCKNGYQLPLTANAGNVSATLVATNLVKTLTDNCTSGANMVYSVTPSAFTCDDIGEREVTLTVTDQSGNSDFCVTTITITDPDNKCGTGALVNCPGDIILEVPADSCAGGLVTMASATINDTLALASIHNNSPYAFEDGANASGYYPLGTTDVIFTATDTSGGIYSCIAKITVKEPEAPIMVCNNNLTLNLALDPITGDANVTVNAASFVKLSMDNCTPSNQLIFTSVPAVLGCDDLGDQMIKIYGEDASGNKDFCIALLNVTDTADICGTLKLQQGACPKDIIITLTGENACGKANVQLLYPMGTGVAEVKNSSVYANGHEADASGAYPIGTTIVNFTVKLENGTTFNCPVKVIVKETTPPVAICRHGVSLKMGKNLSGGGFALLLPSMVNRGSYDNCTEAGALQLTVEPSLFNCTQTGLQRVKLTVKDKSGNTDYCYTYVNILDPDGFCTPGGTNLAVKDGGNTINSDNDNEYATFETSVDLVEDQAKLFQNAPNPFRNQTTIRFYLPSTQDATITLYDMTGKKVKMIRDRFEAGTNELTIDRRDLSVAGFYLVHMETAAYSESCKMILVD